MFPSGLLAVLMGFSVDRPGIVRLGRRCGVLSSCVLLDRAVARVVPACRSAVGLSRWLDVRWRQSILVDRCRIWFRLGVRGCVELDVVVDVGAVVVVFAAVGRRPRVALLRAVSYHRCRSGAMRRFAVVVVCGVGAL